MLLSLVNIRNNCTHQRDKGRRDNQANVARKNNKIWQQGSWVLESAELEPNTQWIVQSVIENDITLAVRISKKKAVESLKYRLIRLLSYNMTILESIFNKCICGFVEISKLSLSGTMWLLFLLLRSPEGFVCIRYDRMRCSSSPAF